MESNFEYLGFLSVSDAWSPLNHRWDFPKRRPFLDREILSWETATQCFPLPSFSSGPDCFIWIHATNGLFSTASARPLFQTMRSRCLNVEPHTINNLWRSIIPRKCKFFVWSIFHRSINTADKLQKKFKHLMISPHWCPLCCQSSESLDHIFLHCKVAYSFWVLLYRVSASQVFIFLCHAFH